MPILNQRLAIAYSAAVGSKEVREIDRQVRASMVRWRRVAKSATPSPVAPEVGVFFWTGNSSLVLVFAIDSDGDGRVLVVKGGHLDESIRGDHPGSWYWVKPTGHARCDSPVASLLGMDLRTRAAVEFAAHDPLAYAPDGKFAWLLQIPRQTPRTLRRRPRGFFRTLNNSLVFVSCESGKPSLRATVCSGGHGVPELNGTNRGERYLLTPDGSVLMSAAEAKTLNAGSIALASGMSLAERLPLIGKGVPVPT